MDTGPLAREVFYSSGIDSDTFPVHGWTAVSGVSPPKIKPGLGDGTFKMSNLDLQEPVYKKIATCEEGWEQQNLVCAAPCPTGWRKKVAACEQTCGGQFPSDGEEGVCGSAVDELQFATLAIERMTANSRLFTPESVAEALE